MRSGEPMARASRRADITVSRTADNTAGRWSVLEKFRVSCKHTSPRSDKPGVHALEFRASKLQISVTDWIVDAQVRRPEPGSFW